MVLHFSHALISIIWALYVQYKINVYLSLGLKMFDCALEKYNMW